MFTWAQQVLNTKTWSRYVTDLSKSWWRMKIAQWQLFEDQFHRSFLSERIFPIMKLVFWQLFHWCSFILNICLHWVIMFTLRSKFCHPGRLALFLFGNLSFFELCVGSQPTVIPPLFMYLRTNFRNGCRDDVDHCQPHASENMIKISCLVSHWKCLLFSQNTCLTNLRRSKLCSMLGNVLSTRVLKVGRHKDQFS